MTLILALAVDLLLFGSRIFLHCGFIIIALLLLSLALLGSSLLALRSTGWSRGSSVVAISECLRVLVLEVLQQEFGPSLAVRLLQLAYPTCAVEAVIRCIYLMPVHCNNAS